MPKKNIIIIIAVCVISMLSVYVVFHASRSRAATTPSSGDVTVILTEQGYRPDTLTVKAGTVVHFRTTLAGPYWPASNPHPQHSVFPEFDSKEPVDADKEWSFRFDRIGHFGFHDHIRSYYTGTIDVIK